MVNPNITFLYKLGFIYSVKKRKKKSKQMIETFSYLDDEWKYEISINLGFNYPWKKQKKKKKKKKKQITEIYSHQDGKCKYYIPI